MQTVLSLCVVVVINLFPSENLISPFWPLGRVIMMIFQFFFTEIERKLQWEKKISRQIFSGA